MGYTVPVSFAIGSAMQPSSVASCFTDALAWLNGGIVTGDVSAITGDRVYGVDHYGFPLQGRRGSVRESGGRGRIDGPFGKRDRLTQRQDIFVPQVQAGGYIPLAGLCGTRFVPVNASVEIVASWWLAETHNYVAAPIGAQQDAGQVLFRYRDRAAPVTGWVTTASWTWNFLSHPEALLQSPSAHAHVVTWFTNAKVTSSVYDFGFFYARGNATAGTTQVSISRPQMALTISRL